jgi:exo-beta-1,3-glucanase (GH17 family)/succinate dehydrogenase hydrophobic anchor subunit
MPSLPNRAMVSPPLAYFALTALLIAVAWWWLGRPVQLPPSPLEPGERLYCISYAPFRGSQDPLSETVRVSAEQIDADLKLLSRHTDCIRTYSVEYGQDQIPEIAQRYGLKVLHGLWLSNRAAKNHLQVTTTIALAKKYPDTIRAVIVGNEVLLRGEMSVTDLEATIREVKSQITQPVTYADVWEFWLRYADLQNAVDFVTIHILPYWEDQPQRASQAAAHVDHIRGLVANAIPNKEIMIGEFGWPSHGRMREGALPSPVNQARAIEETLALGKRENLHVNIIEAFDQPWKRWLEGAVGRYWGIFDRATDGPKFTLGGAVSNHPHWLLQALAGIVLAGLTFGAAAMARREQNPSPQFWLQLWPRIAVIAFVSAVMFGWTIETVPIESYTAGGALRLLLLTLVAAAAPIACAAASAAGGAVPTFASLLGGSGEHGGRWRCGFGAILIALTLLAVQAALGLVFDPRYRDFDFAPLTAAVVPFLVLTFSSPRPGGPRATAELAAAVLLTLAAGYIAINETLANWQSVWFCAALIGLAITLLRARDAPG